MANSLSDLKRHLFQQLERLDDTNLTPEQIEAECKRTDAIVNLADQVNTIAAHQLNAAKLYALHGKHVLDHLPQIGQAVSKDGKP